MLKHYPWYITPEVSGSSSGPVKVFFAFFSIHYPYHKNVTGYSYNLDPVIHLGANIYSNADTEEKNVYRLEFAVENNYSTRI